MVPTLNSTRCRHSATATHDTFEGVRGCFYEVVVIRKSRQEEKKADDLERWLLDDNEIMCLVSIMQSGFPVIVASSSFVRPTVAAAAA